MQTYIALLRGINVGGHHKLPMAELRMLLTNAKFKNIKTYIQSGNVVFQSLETNTLNLETTISTLIENQFGFKIPVLIKTPRQLQSIFENCPFNSNEKKPATLSY